MARQWKMWGHLNERGDWLYVNEHKRTVEMYLEGSEDESTAVLATEDPEGDYLGWMDFEDPTGWREQDFTPVMVQHKQIFNMQFPYGYKAEVERGRGEAVPLRIEAA